jgi:NADH-quinone oxidoreductase subunit J
VTEGVFYFFAGLMLVGGVLVVALRNPVASALSLVVSFVGLAALYVTLNAYFIGVIQVLVYAGAVMVLFLFIIMLLDLRAGGRGRGGLLRALGGVALVSVLLVQLIGVVSGFGPGAVALADVPLDLAGAAAARGEAGPSVTAALGAGRLPDVKLVGEAIYSRYTFHLQVVGVLLLVATVGVVVLSKRPSREPDNPPRP